MIFFWVKLIERRGQAKFAKKKNHKSPHEKQTCKRDIPPNTPFKKKKQESSSRSHILEDLAQEGEGTSVCRRPIHPSQIWPPKVNPYKKGGSLLGDI